MASMTQNFSIANQPATMDDGLLRGLRRSRLSVHFNTPRVRRWLLVQLVSIPVDTEQEHSTQPATPHQASQYHPLDMEHLVDQFQVGQFLRRVS